MEEKINEIISFISKLEIRNERITEELKSNELKIKKYNEELNILLGSNKEKINNVTNM